jgi:tetratricopeptide (TPR) repeat protein
LLKLAREKLEAAVETGVAPIEAGIGLARCEVLVGQGGQGLAVAAEVLDQEPYNLEAWKVVALYHLRSEHWDEAEGAYRDILARAPTDYEALRGFQNVCAVKGKWRDAAFAWQDALERDPENVIFRSYLVWAAACAGEESAPELSDNLRESSPNDRFACLAEMVLAIRRDALDEALEWVRRAAQGPGLPRARELARAAAALRTMIEWQQVPAEAVLLQAALCGQAGRREAGRQLVEEFLTQYPESRWRDLAAEILRDLEQPPATRP